jgi:hypothetical protein
MEEIDLAKLISSKVKLGWSAMCLPEECCIHLYSSHCQYILVFMVTGHITEVAVKATIGVVTSGLLA